MLSHAGVSDAFLATLHAQPDAVSRQVVRDVALRAIGDARSLDDARVLALFQESVLHDVRRFVEDVHGVLLFPENVLQWLAQPPLHKAFPYTDSAWSWYTEASVCAAAAKPHIVRNVRMPVSAMGSRAELQFCAHKALDAVLSLLPRDCQLWFRGTNHVNACATLNMGVWHATTTRHTDFGTPCSPAYYVCDDAQHALLWALRRHRAQPAVLIFGNAAAASTAAGMKRKTFRDTVEEWAACVRTCRTDAAAGATALLELDSVWGPQAVCTVDASGTLCATPHAKWQYAIKSAREAAMWNAALLAVVFFDTGFVC